MSSKIQFVMAGNTELKPTYITKWTPPLSFLSIVTYSSLDMELLDSQIISQDELERRVDCEILAGSINLSNYLNFLKIAERYKEKNPDGKVIVGGHHSYLAKNILRNRPCIDAVVVGEGEVALKMYAGGDNLPIIPNLVYRRKGNIVSNQEKFLAVDELPIPDRSLIDIQKYFRNYKGKFSRPTSMYDEKGCYWGKCVFCSTRPPVRSRTPQQFWEEVIYLEREFGIDYIWNVNESPSKRRLKNLHLFKPRKVNAQFRFYLRSQDVDEEIAKILTEMNCCDVFLGIESGDPGLLSRMNKGVTLDNHLRAVKILAKKGIIPRISFVLGLPGETLESIKNTYKFAKQLLSAGADSIGSSILMPVPGAESFKMILQVPELRMKYAGQDLFQLRELQEDWVTHFCRLDYGTLVSRLKDFEGLIPEKAGGAFRLNEQ